MHWIDTQEQFDQVCSRLANQSLLAIDTEFERRTTCFPLFALLQVSDGTDCWLIDPLAVKPNQTFRNLMSDQSITKVMHSAKEDLEVFFYSWQIQVAGLFDTQVAWSFIQGDLSLGYAGLVDQLLQEHVSKEETQTDWMQRPLTDAQKAYAAKDVEYLIPLYERLGDKFSSEKVACLFEEECKQLCVQVTVEFDPETDYRQAKEVWKLDATQLSLFKRLYNWRENLARQENITRNRICKDQSLVQVALRQPETRRQLSTCTEMHPRAFRLYADVLLEIVKNWKKAEPKPLNPVQNPREVEGLNRLVKRLEKLVAEQSAALGLSPTLIASKRLIRQIAWAAICGEKMPLSWQGWREKLLCQPLKDILAESAS